MAASNSFYASAPTVFMPPTSDEQYFASSHYVDQNGRTVPSSETSPDVSMNATALASDSPLARTPGSLAGCKRSRGDVQNPEDEAGPQQDARKVFELNHTKRPSISSRKSQRIDSSVSTSDELAQLVLPAQMRDVTAEPLIDEATRVLGISWTRMDSSEARQINQAAYTRWIQNHYPSLKEVAIWFEYVNDEVPAYLVKALNAYTRQHEYFIFSHDLTEARLITREANDLVPRLKMMPALHLAAPGGHIRADSESIASVQKETQSDSNEEFREPQGICAAHAMEMD